MALTTGLPGLAGAEQKFAVKADQAPTYVVMEGKGGVKILLDQETVGAKEASMGVITALPGTVIPPHKHDVAELVYIQEGRGEFFIAGQTIPIEQGMALYIPPNTEHGVKVTTTVTPLRAIQVYAPPGQGYNLRRVRHPVNPSPPHSCEYVEETPSPKVA